VLNRMVTLLMTLSDPSYIAYSPSAIASCDLKLIYDLTSLTVGFSCYDLL